MYTGAPEKYNATAVNMGSGPSFAGRVLVSVVKAGAGSFRRPTVRLVSIQP
jgi:hypothetical protein